MASDYNEIIQRVLQGELHDTVFKKPLENLLALATRQPTLSGDRITESYEVARTSPAGPFDKSDVDPASASNTIVKPYWTKTFDQTAAEVFYIDLWNSKVGDADIAFDKMQAEIRKEADSLRDVVYSKIMTQIALDIDSSGTAYSDALLSRSTYPTLASYEEATDTTITAAYVRNMMRGTRLNKKCGPLSGYFCLMESSVYHTFKAIAAALHTWDKANEAESTKMGWPEMNNFEGLKIVHPDMAPGMTTGDVFMIRMADFMVTNHVPLIIKPANSDRASSKAVLYYGLDAHVANPGFNGKMQNKD